MQADEAEKNSSDQYLEAVGLTEKILEQWQAERPDLDLSVFLIGIQIGRLVILSDRRENKIAARFGLKFGEMMVLYALRRQGRPFQLRHTDLFRLLSVSSSTISYRMEKLVRQGFVEKLDDPKDRRGYIIRLTARGRRAVDDAVTESVEIVHARTKRLLAKPAALKALSETLALLAEEWEAYDEPE